MTVRACQRTACLGCVAILMTASLAVASSRRVCGVRSSDSKHTQLQLRPSLLYLALGTLTPSLLSTFANSSSLTCKGSSANVSMIIDWRDLVGCPTSTSRSHSRNAFDAVYSGCTQFSTAGDTPWRQLGGIRSAHGSSPLM